MFTELELNSWDVWGNSGDFPGFQYLDSADNRSSTTKMVYRHVKAPDIYWYWQELDELSNRHSNLSPQEFEALVLSLLPSQVDNTEAVIEFLSSMAREAVS